MAKKLSELYAPKAGLGKAFVDSNKPVNKTTDKSPATGDGKTSFAVPTKTFDRKVHRFGYDVGADEKAYDGGRAVGVNDQPKEKGVAPYTVTRESIIELLSTLKEDASEDDVIDMLFDILDSLVSVEEEEVAEASCDKPKPVKADAPQGYSKDAVNKAIASSNRSGRKISGKEAKAIHRLLKGRYE